MSTSPSPPSKIGLRFIRSEYCRIIKANSRHFNALSLLFLLPFSISLTLYPFLIIQLILQSSTFTIGSHLSVPVKTIILNLLCTLSVSVFFLLATASITYSLVQGFYGQPIKLVSVIKAAFTSFFPLLSTFVVQQLIISGISLILGLSFFSLIQATQVLGFQVNHSSSYFNFLCLLHVTILMFIVVYLQVNWVFAYVIVVVESSWGYEPLKRSQNLVKGMKGVAFKIVLFFGFFNSINTWRSITPLGVSAGADWKSWPFVLNIFATSLFYMLFMLYNLAANTVLYIYSKAQHGEIAEEFEREYASLPFDDDGKVPHVVSSV